MPTNYNGYTVPEPTDIADAPAAFEEFSDSIPFSEYVAVESLSAHTTVVDSYNGKMIFATADLTLTFGTLTDGFSVAITADTGVTVDYLGVDKANQESTAYQIATVVAVNGTNIISIAGGGLTPPGSGKVIEANSSNAALRVTQLGTGYALLVEDSAHPDSTPFVVNSSGNVGIGTSSPAERLHVKDADSTGFTGISVQNNNANVGIAGIDFGSDPTYRKAAIGQLRQNPNGAGPLVFYVDSNNDAENWATTDEKMRIDSAGNVGIGTNDPSWPLDVQATAATQGIKIRGRASDDISVFSFNNNANTLTQAAFSSTSNYLSILVPAAERMRINNAGLITGTGPSLGAWTAYTPTLGNWTLGNGVLEGAYCQIGKTIHCRIVIVLGSTTTISNFPSLGVPLTAQNTSHAFAYGAGANDTSAGTSYIMSARWASTTSVAVFGTGGVNGTELGVGTTLPFAWASGDLIRIAMTYEAA